MGGLEQIKPNPEAPSPPGPPLRPPLKPLADSPAAKVAQAEKAEPQCFEFSVFKEVKKYLSVKESGAFERLVLPYLEAKPNPRESLYVLLEEKKNDLSSLKKEQDKARGEPLEKKINYIRAKIFEALLSALIELYWLPHEAFITETSEFDDWLNGADAVLETKSLLAAIDFTSQKDKEAIHKKMEKVFQGIDNSSLGRLKYFKPQTTKKMLPPLHMIPSVVVGLSQTNMEILLDLYLGKRTQELKNHWAKSAIAEEVLGQIELFKRRINNPTRAGYKPDSAQKMAAAYDNLGKAIQKLAPEPQKPRLQEEKEITPNRRPDSVYQSIMLALSD